MSSIGAENDMDYGIQGYSAQGGDTFIGSSMFLVFIALILLLQLRERKVRLLSMIVMPVFMLLLTGAVISMELSAGPLAWLVLLAGFVIGAAIGLFIASRMHLKIDVDGTMLMRGSLLAVGVWAAILILKVYGKDLMAGTGLVDMNLLTSALLAMTLGMMICRRGYVYYRFMQLKKASGDGDKK
jgi:hypothetical protein